MAGVIVVASVIVVSRCLGIVQVAAALLLLGGGLKKSVPNWKPSEVETPSLNPKPSTLNNKIET